MPRKCSVPGCKSNYDSECRITKTTITTFSFPKDDTLRNKWLRAIPRENWTPSKATVVCVLHFEDRYVITHQDYKNYDGVMQKLLLRCPRLAVDAVPTIFPNLPAYLSKQAPPERKTPDERRTEMLNRHAKAVQDFLEADNIASFSDFMKGYRDRLKSNLTWESKVVESGLWFYTLNSDCELLCETGLQILCSIKVSTSLSVKVTVGGIEIPAHDLNWLFSPDLKLGKWSQFDNLLTRYKETSIQPIKSSDTISYLLDQSKLCLQKTYDLSLSEDNNLVDSKKLKIIIDQIKLLSLVKVKYDPTTIVFSFMIYSQSPVAYNFIRNYLTLPHKRYLQQISSSLKIGSDGGKSNTINYLSHVSKSLSQREKIVSLLIDEIYVNSTLSFKSQNLVGLAENNPNELAKTVLSFMISSPFGKFKEIVRLLPVSGLSGEFLKTMTIEIINFVQQCNFTVISVITDNNRINQNMYKLLSNSNTMPNPADPSKSIFLTYDSVHVFKNINNNWLNRKDNLKTFIYPDFTDLNKTKRACFEHLRMFHRNEQLSIIKRAHKLSNKTLYPNNFERQNVTLADNIFHESTIVALTLEEEYKDTADFLQIIRHWWDIVNTKSTIKGKIKLNKWSGPISSIDDEKIVFLNQFTIWLTKWHELNNNDFSLSKDTNAALLRCTLSLIEIIAYSLQHFTITYVLPGKFQTDKLEERFGQYRRLSGTNYHVSVRQILESEKKIRIKRIFKLIDEKQLILKEAIGTADNVSKNRVDVSDYLSILETDYLDITQIDEATHIYICGYAAHSLYKKVCCSLCLEIFISSKGDKIDVSYFDLLQRGGLTVPSDYVLSSFYHMCAIFQYILNSNLEEIFLKCSNQKAVLVTLARTSLEAHNVFYNVDKFCKCGNEISILFHKLQSTFANILLNNYTKVFNDSEFQHKNKKRKLQTLSK